MSRFELWLLRHGRSTGNRDRVRQGQGDYALTETGRQQAHDLAERWRAEGVRFDTVISSPLQRALQTAQILHEALGVGTPLETDETWMERNAGRAEGDPLAESPTSRSRPHRLDAHMPPFEGAETRLDLHLRAGTALRSLLARPPGRYLIVAHGGILAASLCVLLGLAPAGRAPLPGFAFENAAFAVIQYEEHRGHWRLLRLNDTAHIRS